MTDIICAKCGKHLSSIEDVRRHKCVANNSTEVRSVRNSNNKKELTKQDWDIINMAFNYRYTEHDDGDKSEPIVINTTRRTTQGLRNNTKITDKHATINNPFDQNRVGYYKSEYATTKKKRNNVWAWVTALILIAIIIVMIYAGGH